MCSGKSLQQLPQVLQGPWRLSRRPTVPDAGLSLGRTRLALTEFSPFLTLCSTPSASGPEKQMPRGPRGRLWDSSAPQQSHWSGLAILPSEVGLSELPHYAPNSIALDSTGHISTLNVRFPVSEAGGLCREQTQHCVCSWPLPVAGVSSPASVQYKKEGTWAGALFTATWMGCFMSKRHRCSPPIFGSYVGQNSCQCQGFDFIF